MHGARTQGPTSTRARAPAPDVCRGVMLLFVALAHSHLFLYAGTLIDGSPLDRAVVLLRTSVISGRAFPLFFLLFGYGMVQLARRQNERGADWTSTRRLLRRRGGWLIVIGAIHVVLLFPADVLAGYGLASLLLVGMLRASDRRLLLVIFASFILVAAVSALPAQNPDGAYPLLGSMAQGSLLDGIGPRLGEWLSLVVLLGWQIVPGMLLGIWAARRRLLEEPQRHRPRLAAAAITGLTVATLGGLPLGLSHALIWDASEGQAALAGAVHGVTGYAGGLGWAAVIALVVARSGKRQGFIFGALGALGRRSLSFYLFQSLVFVAVFAPYAGGLGAHLTVSGAAAIAVATWVASIVCADVMRRLNQRGPAEILLRRLTYGTAS
jgi:uncharacterized protein